MMKKSIFAVAVASALTLGAAQAETVLYGSIRYDYESKKDNAITRDNNGFHKYTSNRVSNLSDAGSRIGLKGSEDLGNNFAVIYNLEWGFDGMEQGENGSGSAGGFKNRLAVLGLTSDFGTLTAGRQDNPFKVTLVDDSIQDDFNGSNVISSASQRAMTTALKATNVGATAIQDNGNVAIQDADFSRVGKVIAYTTPEFAGFQANAAVMMDSDLYPKNNRKNADLWTINAKYAYDLNADSQILAKLGYIQGKVSGRTNQSMKNSSKVWGLYLGYLSDTIKVSASYADGNQNHINGQTGPKAKSKGWDLGASYSFGPNYFSTVRATYGQSELKVDGDKDKVKSWAVGFEQKLSTRTRAWVEYGNEETKFADNNVDKKKDNVISVGMRHDF